MTPQDKQVADYLAEVQANERRKQALDNAVYQLVTNGTAKDKQEAQRDIVLTIKRRYRRPTKLLRERYSDTRNSLDELRKRVRRLVNYLDVETAGVRDKALTSDASIMLRRVEVDLAEEIERLEALAAAALKAKENVPHPRGGRPYDDMRRRLALVCVRLAEEYDLLGDTKTQDLGTVYDLFTDIYPLATGKNLPKQKPNDDTGKPACRWALEKHWREQAASGHKEEEHSP